MKDKYNKEMIISYWTRENYYKINKLIKFKGDNETYNVITESLIVKILIESNNRLFNKIGLLLSHDYQMIDRHGCVKRNYKKNVMKKNYTQKEININDYCKNNWR